MQDIHTSKILVYLVRLSLLEGTITSSLSSLECFLKFLLLSIPHVPSQLKSPILQCVSVQTFLFLQTIPLTALPPTYIYLSQLTSPLPVFQFTSLWFSVHLSLSFSSSLPVSQLTSPCLSTHFSLSQHTWYIFLLPSSACPHKARRVRETSERQTGKSRGLVSHTRLIPSCFSLPCFLPSLDLFTLTCRAHLVHSWICITCLTASFPLLASP